jgi:glycosyltransferase involved in cell wall biosynthesis
VNKPSYRVLAIIPAFNEQENIGPVIDKIRQVDNTIDILVIDDGSRDRTASVARLHGAKALILPNHMGYGVALQTGYKYAFRRDYDFAIQLDGDGQHEPECITELLNIAISGEADLVLGSRFLEKTSDKKTHGKIHAPGMARKIGIILFSHLTSFLVGFKVTDPTSGFQIINKKVMNFFTKDFFPCDYPDADVILFAHRAGFTIKEAPVVVYERVRGRSMHAGIKPAYYTFKMFLSILMTLLRKKPPFLENEKSFFEAHYPEENKDTSSSSDK